MIALLGSVPPLPPASSPSAPSPSAARILAAARKDAARERKNVLVLFEASWCPWCRRFDALLQDPALAPAWTRGYTVAKIRVRERGDQKPFENSGWETEMRRYRGRSDVDVPYMVVLDPKGRKLADSLRLGDGPIPSNAGYPSKPEEIDAFVTTVGTTGRFTPEELASLRAYFAR